MLKELELLSKSHWVKFELDVDRDSLDVIALLASDSQSEALVLQIMEVQCAFIVHEASDHLILQNARR